MLRISGDRMLGYGWDLCQPLPPEAQGTFWKRGVERRGGVRWTAVLWTWHSCRTGIHSSYGVTCTKSHQSKLQHERKVPKAPPLTEDLRAVSSRYERESHFSPGWWVLLDNQWLCEWSHPHMHMGIPRLSGLGGLEVWKEMCWGGS